MPRVKEKPEVTIPPIAAVWRVEMGDHVIALAWSSDSSMVAAASVSGEVAVYSAQSGERLPGPPPHTHGALALNWSADGALLASSGQDGKARIWDAEWSRVASELDGGGQWVGCVAFAPRGRCLATAAGRKVRFWEDGKLIRECADAASTISDLKWQPDEAHCAAACYGSLNILRPDAAEPVKSFPWKGSILCVEWSPDGNCIATGNQDATVHFWYRRTGKDLEMSGYPLKVRELAWDGASRLLATGGGPIVTVWNCSGKGPAGSRPIELVVHTEAVSALAFQRRGRLLASGGREGRVALWEPSVDARARQGIEMQAGVTQVAWSKNDRLLAVATEAGTVAVFRP